MINIASEDGSIDTSEEGRNPALQKFPGDVTIVGSFGPRNVSHLANVVFELGEKGSGLRPLISSVQDFAQLKKECLDSGLLFEDLEFPAQPFSIYRKRKVEEDIRWIRPPGMVSNPEFFVSGASRFDVNQEQIGDCWFLAALGSLVMHQKLFSQVVPENQSFEKGEYAGIFHFRFWKYGRWVDVVIDDRLPMHEGGFIGARSTTANEFWSALLEKAYAKLHGSYEALNIGGWSGEALEDFTGGVVERYDVDDLPPNLFSIMLKAQEKNSLMTCVFTGNAADNKIEADNEGDDDKSIENEGAEENDKSNENVDNNEVENHLEANKKVEGVYANHEYSITQVRYVRKETENGEKVPLVRVRNPWGNNKEWEGAWSDGSPEWDFISSQEKEELGVKPEFNADGEFWMSLEDFKSHLAFLEVCHLNPISVIDSNLSRHTKEWVTSAFEGEWVRGATAGGPDTDSEKFMHNPQYCITLEEESTVIVALMQKNQRAKAQFAADQHLNFLQTGFTVYPVRFWSRLMKIMKLKGLPSEKLSKPLDLSFFKNIKTRALDIDSATDKSAPRYLQIGWGREVVCRIKLIPGAYCIVPHTKESDEEGEFLLRVFSETPNNMEEYDVQVSIVDVDRMISANESWIEKLREFFQQLAGGDSELDWIEQKKFFDSTTPKELHKVGFNKEICRSIVSMLDLDRSGKLGFHEFKIFWRIITNLKKAFQEIYAETNAVAGMLSTFYLREALKRAGYRVNTHILGRLVRHYGTNDQKITFEDFVMCAVRLKTMIGMFKERDLDQTNTVTFAMEELFDTILYY